ncbi:MAG: hypothetical protein M1812_006621 [Candelaria pacifica]|nr:MAG: hypothetical protein M1812_006621 [Candelaria pacifica]
MIQQNATITTDDAPKHHHHVLHHLLDLPLTTVSELVPYSGLIFSCILILFFFAKHYLLESNLLPKLYGETYTKLDIVNRRGFLNHHIAGASKIICLALAIYPFFAVVCAGKNLHSPYAPGSTATLGDVLVVASLWLVAMYAFELIYRIKISPIGIAHHVGTILIGQSALVLGLDPRLNRDVDIEFIICLLWGAFDIISEFWPHVAIILYRVYPNNHNFLRKVFKIACISTLFGTFCETVITMFFFGSLWDRWTIDFKIATPVLHVVFTIAQLHGSRVFWIMMRRQEMLLREEGEGGERDLEGQDGVERLQVPFDTVGKEKGNKDGNGEGVLGGGRPLSGVLPDCESR